MDTHLSGRKSAARTAGLMNVWVCVCVLQIRAARLEQLEKELQEARGSQDSQLQVRVVTFDPFCQSVLVLNSLFYIFCVFSCSGQTLPLPAKRRSAL